MEGMKYFTPFKYFEAKNLMLGSGLEPLYIVISVIVAALLLVVTFTFYKKRDLNA